MDTRMLFTEMKPVVGMVHLPPLPGSVRYTGTFEDVITFACNDAVLLAESGFDAIMVENYGDVPFSSSSVESHTIAALTRIITEIQGVVDIPIGVNVLRNDPIAALAICAATRASFIRVNVLIGAMVTDQGIIEGQANRVAQYRKQVAHDVMLLADVDVKHARPLVERPIVEIAQETVERGLADALIVTGSQTGQRVSTEELQIVRRDISSPVLVGSGLDSDSVSTLLPECDGAIVGSYLKEDGIISRPIDAERCRAFMEEVATVRQR